MESQKPAKPKTGRTFDSAYGFSFSIALGLLLFIAGLVISLTLGRGAGIGLIFGIPLLIAGSPPAALHHARRLQTRRAQRPVSILRH